MLILNIPLFGFAQNDTLRYYHDNGQLGEIGIFKDGKKEGLYKQYHQDGSLDKTINYKNGLYNGLWTNYRRNENNELVIDESIYINGRREGTWKMYVGNTLKTEGYLKNKMKNRIWKYYHDNGQVKTETKWIDDKKIYSKYWDENGTEIEQKH